jgi:hypothetical protein
MSRVLYSDDEGFTIRHELEKIISGGLKQETFPFVWTAALIGADLSCEIPRCDPAQQQGGADVDSSELILSKVREHYLSQAIGHLARSESQ